LIIGGSKDYGLMQKRASSVIPNAKLVGLMRLAMILDMMSKALSADRVAANV